jgi:hypothetical protein
VRTSSTPAKAFVLGKRTGPRPATRNGGGWARRNATSGVSGKSRPGLSSRKRARHWKSSSIAASAVSAAIAGPGSRRAVRRIAAAATRTASVTPSRLVWNATAACPRERVRAAEREVDE